MTDRELLELSAKAAGYVFSYGATPLIETIDSEIEQPYTVWNPLTDDGDALRLAVKLNIQIERWDDCVDAKPHYSMLYVTELDVDSDPYAATRRAIVRAAAEIGKEMK